MSREIIRQVEAVPTFRVTRHYTDQETARHATQAKEIYGYLVIPNQFEADATAGRDATLSYYYHYALLSVGGEVRGAFETLLRTLSLAPVVVQATAMGLGENQITTFLLPIAYTVTSKMITWKRQRKKDCSDKRNNPDPG